ncbi:MAG: hypothetical protein AAFR81_18410 [Chloroflexota bacterium]
MAKRKGRFEGKAQFISDLSLEQCQQALGALVDENIRIEFQPATTDRVHFTAKLYERGQVRAVGDGILRRWEGTLTRVDCEVAVREGLLLWIVGMVVLSLVAMVGLPVLFLMASDVNATPFALLSLIFVKVVIATMLLVNRLAPHDDTPRNLLARIHEVLR